jgi:hypothetical protein
MKLSEAIRKGHTMIGEERAAFLLRDCGCAVGAALVGLGYSYSQRLKDGSPSGFELMQKVAEETGTPLAIIQDISARHYCGESRLSLADWVEREYESKPPQRESDHDYTRRVLDSVVAETVTA